MPNVVLVHTPGLQARDDFEKIVARIEALDKSIKAFIATNGEDNTELNERIGTQPTLIFSPVEIQKFKPARGRIYQGGTIDKIAQYQRLLALGLPTPKTKLLTKGDVFTEREWGAYLVLKPFSPKLQSNGVGTYRIATKRLTFDLNINRMFEQYNVEGGTLVQEYVNTGPQLEYHRVLTLFGEPLYSLRNHLAAPIDLETSQFPTGTTAIATQSYSAEQLDATMNADSRYLDLARSTYAAFPNRALQAIDILRSQDSDRLYVLEMNLGGNTWHFSSGMIDDRVTSRQMREEFRQRKLKQFGAFDVVAKTLAKRAVAEAV